MSLSLLLQLAGCRLQDDFIAAAIKDSNPGGAAGEGASGGGATVGTGGKDSGGSAQGGSGNTCPADRPAISLPLGNGSRAKRCSSWAARRSFTQAICSCSDLSVKGALTTSSLDSSQSDANAHRSGAAVSVNGNYQGADYVRVGGSFTIAGTAPLDSAGGIDVSGDLRLSGTTSAAGPILVGRDAWLLADTSSLSLANVGRDLHLAPGATLHSFGPVVVAGDTFQDPFAFSPPCACGPGQILDIASIVADGLADNDDAVLGIDLDSLSDVATPTDLTLRCGRFALRQISGRAPISLHVSGRVALMVDGDVKVPPVFTLTLEPEAELDWFISGSLTLSRDERIGDSARPAAVRVYVLGGGGIELAATERVAMNLYAPRANVTVSALGDVYGSLFANSITSPIPLVTHYDRLLLHADDTCGLEPPATCSACDQCRATNTCAGAACVACQTDSDCCFPLACQQGECHGLPAN